MASVQVDVMYILGRSDSISPMITPPMSAPQMDPNPPSTTMTKDLTSNGTPTVGKHVVKRGQRRAGDTGRGRTEAEGDIEDFPLIDAHKARGVAVKAGGSDCTSLYGFFA